MKTIRIICALVIVVLGVSVAFTDRDTWAGIAAMWAAIFIMESLGSGD